MKCSPIRLNRNDNSAARRAMGISPKKQICCDAFNFAVTHNAYPRQ
jgi:hypothetical protein